MGGSVYRDMLRRVDQAVTFTELRALRRFSKRRLEGDDRLAQLDELIEQKAMAMIAEADAALKQGGKGDGTPKAGRGNGEEGSEGR